MGKVNFNSIFHFLSKILSFLHIINIEIVGFSSGSEVKNPLANAGGTALVPELGRSPGEGNGNPLQYSCLWNPMDREAWLVTVHGATKESGHNFATK